MDEKQKEVILSICALASVISLIFIISALAYNQTSLSQIYKDTNTLLQNDQAMANYIQANSSTMESLNKNCKQTADTNETITLTCLKIKECSDKSEDFKQYKECLNK